MNNKKGQVNIIGFSIVTLILITSVSIAFLFGRQIVDRSTNINELGRIENQFVDLHTAIKEVANERSQRSVSFTIKDGWLIIPSNNSIRFESFGDLPNQAKFNENRLIFGNYSSDGPCFNNSALGRLGYDDPGCLIQKGGAIYELDYIILNDTLANECFSILLNAGGNVGATKGDHKILLTYNNTKTGSSPICSTTYYSVVNVRVD